MATKGLKVESAPPTPAEVSVLIEGDRFVFRDDASRAIYVSDADQPGQSLCDTACAAKWRPLVAPKDARPVGAWTVIARKDDVKQWAYKGRPVYTFADDTTAVPKGDGADGVWHVLKP